MRGLDRALLAPLNTLLAVLLAGLGGYLGLLTVAALFADRAGPRAARPGQRRFAFLVPAHNEEALIGRVVDNLLGSLDYPREQYHVYVVADNCTDRTAELAREHGARVYERTDLSLRGKGYALRWLLARIGGEHGPDAHDAYVVLDADSVVAPNFLASMDARLGQGAQVVQAYYTVLNAAESPVAALRYAALAAVHYVRPLGHAALGLSAGLKGNGMCFAASVFARVPWEWFTLAEDVEFHLALVNAGIRVDFAPETWVQADMPVTFEQATSQNERWEQGRLQLLRGPARRLLVEGLRRGSLLRIDAAAEQFVPPLSVAWTLAGACLALSVVRRSPWLAALSVASLLMQAAHLLVGLWLVRAPASAYRALAYAPIYVAWKVGLYLRALARPRASEWVRTQRNPSPPSDQ